MSSGSPSSQLANDGDASRLLRLIANLRPLLRRVERFQIDDADLARTAAAESAGSIATDRGRGRRATSVSITFDRKMCSRLRTGSASMPNSASRPDVADAICSRNASPSATSSAAARETISSTVIGMPALEPGV